MLALLALACTPTPSVPEARVPTPWSGPAVPTTSPSEPLTPADLAAILPTWLDAMASLDPDPLITEWRRLAALGDGACPVLSQRSYGFGEYQSWITDGCTATSGASFRGYTEFNDSEGPEDDGWTAGRRSIWANVDVADPAGVTWHGLGSVDVVDRWRDRGDGHVDRELARSLVGDMVWTDPDAAPPWRPDGPQHETKNSRWWTTGVGGVLLLDAWVSGDLGAATAVAAHGFTLRTTSHATCEANEPSGELAVRDRAGRWTHLFFHGPRSPGAPADGPCDGCADRWIEGEVVDQLCLDLSSLVADLERP